MQYVLPDVNYEWELKKIQQELCDLKSIDENSAYEFMKDAYITEIEELRATLSNEMTISRYLESLSLLSCSAPECAGEYGRVLNETLDGLKKRNEESLNKINDSLAKKESLLLGLTKKDAYATLCSNIDFYEMRLHFLAGKLQELQEENASG